MENVQETGVPKKNGARSGWKIFWGIVTTLSILGNIILFGLLMLVSAFALLGVGIKDYYIEDTIREGVANNKIAVLNVKGIIDEKLSDEIIKQMKMIREDGNIKGLILRVDSPGGLVSASDRIYNCVTEYRQQTGKPAVAFMENMAASGGYYTSVACKMIVAEPTTITGSIGVILNYFVLQDLLEGKLGIQPVVVKSGLKKDWPSMFRPPDEEQLSYLQEKLIGPAYERFVGIVADSRKSLSQEQVRKLADGSIYSAKEALEEQLIDKIGYIDTAIEEVEKQAGIQKAKVVEYRKPFSLLGLLNASADKIPKIDAGTIHELVTPQVMYLWSIH